MSREWEDKPQTEIFAKHTSDKLLLSKIELVFYILGFLIYWFNKQDSKYQKEEEDDDEEEGGEGRRRKKKRRSYIVVDVNYVVRPPLFESVQSTYRFFSCHYSLNNTV